MFHNPFKSTAARHESTARMTRNRCLGLPSSLSLACLLAAVCLQPVAAALPALKNPPWWGCYAVYADKNYEFKITAAEGTATLVSLGEGAPLHGSLLIQIQLGITATQPDGKTVFHPIRADTLESTDPATDKLVKSVIRGKTAGDAVLEITLEQSRGIMFIGGRVLEPGTLAGPLAASVTVAFPNVNPPVALESHQGELSEREARKAAKMKAKETGDKQREDSLSLKRIDGQRQKITFDKSVDAGTKEINGSGIASTEVKIAAYGKNKFHFTASAESALKISNTKTASLSEGFSIQCFPDPDKNKDGKARLAIEVK